MLAQSRVDPSLLDAYRAICSQEGQTRLKRSRDGR